MTLLLKLLGMRRPSARSAMFMDAPDSESGVSSGWHESSSELRRGLTVLEGDEPDDERDRGPDTRPFAYQVDA